MTNISEFYDETSICGRATYNLLCRLKRSVWVFYWDQNRQTIFLLADIASAGFVYFQK
jgi:hypothetical protein